MTRDWDDASTFRGSVKKIPDKCEQKNNLRVVRSGLIVVKVSVSGWILYFLVNQTKPPQFFGTHGITAK